MTENPKTTSSIFQDGRLKPGTYRIRNTLSGTYVDIDDRLSELCGRPYTALENRRGLVRRPRGLWEIQPKGQGYTIRKASTVPSLLCIMLGEGGFGGGLWNERAASVAGYPVAWVTDWRIEIVKDANYHGTEYFRIFWRSTNMAWDLAKWGSRNDWTKVQLMDNSKFGACRIWELIPVE